MTQAATSPPERAPGPAVRGVLMVGEALVDVVRTPDGSVSEHPGGSPANVALTLGRLGRPTRLHTRLGDDDHGRVVAAHLEASGVELTPGSVVPGRTATAQAVLDETGAATYVFDIEWDLPSAAPPAGPAPLAVHVGSISAVLAPGAAKVRELVDRVRARSTVSYDPNLRPDLMGSPETVRATVESFVAAADVVKLSDEDARWLEPGVTPDELATRWLALGPAVVVVTRGGLGARARCADGVVDVPGLPVKVADTVGAGDSFSGALLDSLWTHGLLGGDQRDSLRRIDTRTLQDVVQHAVSVAAVTVSRPGADPPRLDELSR